MNKKIYYYIGVLFLVCFSFYYTDLATVIIKENDPIMKEIKKQSNKYYVESVNAEIINNTITPGINGKKVDIKKSYESMKRYGSYNESLFVFEEIIPTNTIEHEYNKYIYNGNISKKNTSLVFEIEDYSHVSEVLNIIISKDIKATFFITEEILNESFDLVKLINSSGSELEIYSSNYENVSFNKDKRIIKNSFNKQLKYCILNREDNKQLEICSKNNMHTIIPDIQTTEFPYNDIKTSLKNGSIIKLNNNEETLRELKYIINYLNQKGYKILTLEELLKE